MNIIFAGVGGQGVILAGKVLMEVARNAGYDVKESEVHGMAQRGGSVDCQVRYGEKVHSPLIRKRSADFILSFELIEILRKIDLLAPGGKALVNRLRINPAPVESGLMDYPDDVEPWIEANLPSVRLIDTEEALREAGSKKAVNIIMLGALSKELEFSPEDWIHAIEAMVKPKFVEMNIKAFNLGREL